MSEGICNWREANSLTLNGETGIKWGSWDEPLPKPIPKSINVGDKIVGMMLGLAIGDALGNSVESLLPKQRRQTHGWIEDYLPNKYVENKCVGLPSDDTQLAFWTLECLTREKRFDPEILGISFCHHRIYGLGGSVREFLRNFKSGLPWSQSGARSAGNGALMRIAPMLIPHLNNPSLDLWGDVVLSAHLTHRDGLSTASCIGFIALLWEAISMNKVPSGDWWLSRFLYIIREIEPDIAYKTREAPIGFSGKLTELIERHVISAYEQQLETDVACNRWYSGAYCLETVPSVLFILARYGHDPQRAILEAVNNTKDNDTIAAIVGAAVGALHGTNALRKNWIDKLIGRTRADDDHQVFSLLAQAGNTFGFDVPDFVVERARQRMPQYIPDINKRFIDSIISSYQFNEFWIKIFGMLREHFASIVMDKNSGDAIIFFMSSGPAGHIFDFIRFRSKRSAEEALKCNGFRKFNESDAEFICKPGPVFRWCANKTGIYSSGLRWRPE